jgi:hypothetical protein
MRIIKFTAPQATYGIIDGFTVDFYFTYFEKKKGFLKDIQTQHTFRINISRWALISWGFRDVKFDNEEAVL